MARRKENEEKSDRAITPSEPQCHKMTEWIMRLAWKSEYGSQVDSLQQFVRPIDETLRHLVAEHTTRKKEWTYEEMIKTLDWEAGLIGTQALVIFPNPRDAKASIVITGRFSYELNRDTAEPECEGFFCLGSQIEIFAGEGSPAILTFIGGALRLDEAIMPEALFHAHQQRIGDLHRPLKLNEIITIPIPGYPLPNLEITSQSRKDGKIVYRTDRDWQTWTQILLQLKS